MDKGISEDQPADLDLVIRYRKAKQQQLTATAELATLWDRMTRDQRKQAWLTPPR